MATRLKMAEHQAIIGRARLNWTPGKAIFFVVGYRWN